MTFQPRMSASLSGISVIETLKCRTWSCAVADVWHAEAEEGALGAYVSPDPRLFVILEHEGGGIDLRLAEKGPVVSRLEGNGSLTYVPAGVPLWTHNTARMRVRHLDVHFDLESLRERIGEPIDPEVLARPQFALQSRELLSLAALIALECSRDEGRHDLYGNGLALALFVAVLQIGRAAPGRRSMLAPWQLRRVKTYIEEHCMRSIRLRELAGLTGLSQSYVSLAFKHSTGLPPHAWQMQARIRQVKKLLADRELSIRDIAAAAGFSDQAHLTRTFRQLVGITPAVWRKENSQTDNS